MFIDGNENKVQGNYIGTDVEGKAALGNKENGVSILVGSNNLIGSDLARNIISGNGGDGVRIDGSENKVLGNYIGTDKDLLKLSNTGVGVLIIDSGSTIRDNTLAFNDVGVAVRAGTKNLITENSIFNNDNLGIDLELEGVTPNDDKDPDPGPNLKQNFPILTEAKAGNSTRIKGKLNSTPSTTFHIEFFANPECDQPFLHGEGKDFFRGIFVRTDNAGNADIDFTVDVAFPLELGTFITATATDPDNNTSEFSPCVQVTSGECALICPQDQSIGSSPGQCGAFVNYTPPAGGSCGTVTCSPPPGSFFSTGATLVTCASDASASCSFTVTVRDLQPPDISCPPDMTVDNSSGQCSAAVSYSVTATDNCDQSLTPSCTPPSGSTFPVGTTAVNCFVADSGGNRALCSFNVTVRDTEQPSITCPDNITTTTAGTCAVVNYPASASDNCSSVTPSCSPPSGSCFSLGTTTVTCTATDEAGNSASCSFTVTVNSSPQVNVTVDKSGPSTASCGTQITYSFTVRNFNPDPAFNVRVVDTLPTCTTFVPGSFSGQGTAAVNGNTVTVMLGNIELSGFRMFSFRVAVSSSCGSTIANQATVRADNDSTPHTDTHATTVTCSTSGSSASHSGKEKNSAGWIGLQGLRAAMSYLALVGDHRSSKAQPQRRLLVPKSGNLRTLWHALLVSSSESGFFSPPHPKQQICLPL